MTLVAILIFMTGLGGAGLTLSNECANGHCDNHMIATVSEHHTGHISGEAQDSTPRESNEIEHDECNPFLCNVLALTLTSSETVFDQSEAALAWEVSRLSTLEGPDSPERPPNL